MTISFRIATLLLAIGTVPLWIFISWWHRLEYGTGFAAWQSSPFPTWLRGAFDATTLFSLVIPGVAVAFGVIFGVVYLWDKDPSVTIGKGSKE